MTHLPASTSSAPAGTTRPRPGAHRPRRPGDPADGRARGHTPGRGARRPVRSAPAQRSLRQSTPKGMTSFPNSIARIVVPPR
jgi:hypothetical protein